MNVKVSYLTKTDFRHSFLKYVDNKMSNHSMMNYKYNMYNGMAFWNPTRARNFLKKFGTPQKTFAENMTFMAKMYDPNMSGPVFHHAVSPKEFIAKINPRYTDEMVVTIAVDLMGSRNVIELYNNPKITYWSLPFRIKHFKEKFQLT